MKSIVCIPGPWKDRDELVISLPSNNSFEYMMAGYLLLNIPTGKSFEVEVRDRDERMVDSFKVAGLVNQVTDPFLEDIDKHNMVVYLIAEGGNLESATALAKAGMAILNAGGVGLKVETAGKAFMKDQWADLLKQDPEGGLYQMFVLDSITADDETVFSCGMHNLGLRDTIVSGESFAEAIDLISTFSYYQIIDKPTIHPGQTFSRTADDDVFQILEEVNPPNEDHDLFSNPWGVWRLQRMGVK